jgi:redox-sensitive bicupin YhaK (pirin superfamily)
MISIRRSEERGLADHGWLKSYHTFSFADYHDPEFMGFRALRVINQDRVAPGKGFGMHPHRDMEIVSYVVEGALQHKDSMGNGAVLKPGEVQRISAGTGILHSEFNPSSIEPVHFLQIWIMPGTPGVKPGYAQKDFSAALDSGEAVLLASPDGADGSISINQDCRIFGARLKAGGTISQKIEEPRHAWLQVISGELAFNGVEQLGPGDACSLAGESELKIEANDKAEVLIFDLV